MKKKRISQKRTLGLLCSLVCLLNLLFAFSSAYTADAELVDAPVYTEVLDAREELVKVFSTGDEQYVAAIYDTPVHYQDETGVWQDIDNSLQSVSLRKDALLTAIPADVYQTIDQSSMNAAADLLTNARKAEKVEKIVPTGETIDYYQNKSNAFQVSFPKKLQANTPVVITHNDHSMAFSLLNAHAAKAKVGEVADTAKKKASAQDRAVTLTASQSAVTYENIDDNTYLEYHLRGNRLKENLIFTAMPTTTDFYFVITTALSATLQKNKSVVLYETDEDDPVFIINAPYMFDAMDEMSFAVDVELEAIDGGYIYRLQADEAWLADESRVYPVTLDPSVNTPQTTAIEDNGVNEYNPKDNYYTMDRIYVGSNYSNSRAYESRMYIRFPRATAIPTTAYISKATFNLQHYTAVPSWQTAVNLKLDVYEVGNNNWVSEEITWEKQAGYTFGSHVGTFTRQKINTKDSVNVRSAVQKWYSTTAGNNGLVIKPQSLDTAKTNRTCYFSSDGTTKEQKPVIEINYALTSMYVRNIKNKEGYFIRNMRYGDCMGIHSDSNGANVDGYAFQGILSQQWRSQHNADGTYTFISSGSGTHRRLNVDSATANMNIYPAQTTGQSFTLTRYSNTAFFYIKYGNKYVSLDSEKNIYLSSTSHGTASLWAFEYIYAMLCPLYSELFQNPIPPKYQKSTYTSRTGSETLRLMQGAKVFLADGHGSPTVFDTGGGGLTYQMIEDLPNGALSQVKLIIYISCECGKGNTNLTTIAHEKGAQAVIGFKVPVDGLADVWADEVLKNLKDGKTIKQAMAAGDVAAYNDVGQNELNQWYQAVLNRTVCGDTSLTIIE